MLTPTNAPRPRTRATKAREAVPMYRAGAGAFQPGQTGVAGQCVNTGQPLTIIKTGV